MYGRLHSLLLLDRLAVIYYFYLSKGVVSRFIFFDVVIHDDYLLTLTTPSPIEPSIITHLPY